MVTIQTIQTYLADKLKTMEVTLNPIVGLGEVNQVYKVEAHGIAYILRVNDESEYDSFIKESWCYEQAQKQKIPVPKIFDVSKSDGASFILMEFIEGENCSNILDKDFQTQVYKQLGEYVRKLSVILPAEDVGNLNSINTAKKWFYKDYLGYEISQTSNSDDYLEISNTQRASIIKALNQLMHSEFSFSLCHGDISLKNCIYVEQSELLYLIDFGNAETQIKDYFEIMLKWLDVEYKKTLSESDFIVFAAAVLENDARFWLSNNMEIIKALALVETLDKYRFAHDRAPEWEFEYKKRFYKVLEIVTN